MLRQYFPVMLFLVCVSLSAAANSNSKLSDTTATREELSNATGLGQSYVRLEIRYRGAYRIFGRELAGAGVDLRSIDPGQLAMWNEGHEVPILLTLATPGEIQPQDTVEFIGDYPRGTFSTYKPDNTYNIYFLNWETKSPAHYRVQSLKTPLTDLKPVVYKERRHLEKDFYYRVSGLAQGITDNFYWFHFNAGTPDTFPFKVDFPGFAPESNEPVRLKFRIFGFSDAPSVKPTHRFGIEYVDTANPPHRVDLGEFQFDGKRNYDYETSIPASAVREGCRFVFRTPPDRDNAVDAISLDWVEASYPRKLDAEGRDLFYFNSELEGDPHPKGGTVHGVRPGTRVFSPQLMAVYCPETSSSSKVAFEADPTTTTAYAAVSPDGLYSVESIVYKQRTDLLKLVPKNTEALVIYQSAVAESAKAYINYRNTTGIATAGVNVDDIFDRLNNGFISDLALKQFIRYTVTASPIHYIVLWGDSTSDYRQATTYDDPSQPRILIPIHWISNPNTTWTKGYVDDNWYASFYYANTPDVALGRIPATTEATGFEYLRKVIEYEQLKKSKDDKALLLSSVESSFQDLAKETELAIKDRFSTVTLLFPDTKHAAEEVQRLQDEFNGGIQLLYYIGHGGALVWRVGPVDFTKQKDLFTPTDVAKLKNRSHYPIVAASSCYTTSFDYDYSLGEALILQPEAGAIAIVGAPWKSTVYEDHNFNKHFISEYNDPENDRLGQAFVKTKRQLAPRNPNEVDSQTFTLLGDPCLELSRR